MLDAHIDSMIALGEPFRATSPSPFPFTNQTITSRVREQVPLMLRERLTPPPPETYSLNRKLSGAFLLCAKLGAEVKCRDMMQRVTAGYKFGSESYQALHRGGGRRIGAARSLHTSARSQGQSAPSLGESSSLS